MLSDGISRDLHKFSDREKDVKNKWHLRDQLYGRLRHQRDAYICRLYYEISEYLTTR